MSIPIGTQNSSHRLLQYRELGAVLLQILLVVIVFKKLLFHPGQYLLVDYFDGLKSYFSIEAFLRQPLADGMLLRGQNYPMGEYMYYTDSTPLLVQSLHLLVRAFPALAPYGLYLYDLFIIGGLVLSTWLLHHIFRPMGLPGWLAVIISVALPWLCPQAIRMQVGHMSLSYSPAMLFTFWVMQQIYLAWMSGQQSVRKWFIWLTIGIFITSYLHFYYLGVLGTLGGFFFLFWVVREYRAGRPWLRLAQYAVVSLVAALVTTAGLLMLLDPRYNQRPVGSGGYDWIFWKFQFGSLFRGYEYNKIRFPFEQLDTVPYESSSYLTAFVLYGLIVVAILSLVKRRPRVQFLEKSVGQFLWLFFLASLPLVSISLGEEYLLGNDKYILHNYSNPFLWLHIFTERVTQFRALGRFIWPFWWAMLLGFSWYVAHWWRYQVLRWFLLGLVLLLILDTRDALSFYSSKIQRPNPLTASGPTAQTRQFLSWIETKQYQAILPFPLYHSGSEGTPYYNVDGDDAHSTMTYQLSTITNLPMMSHKATRSIAHDARLITTVVQPGGPDPELLTKLDDRPILVYVDSAYYNGQDNYYRDQLKDRPDMLALFERTDNFIREQHMKLLRRQGTQSLYEWYPKGSKAQSLN